MNKMNKKGFTLIEMLVVIAIIAVLVSIIIPVVSNSTEKAAAATNAANLRSLKAEAITASLTRQASTTNLTLTYDDYGNIASIAVTASAPKSKTVKDKCGVVAAEFELKNGDIIPTYNDVGIEEFAGIAGGTATSEGD